VPNASLVELSDSECTLSPQYPHVSRDTNVFVELDKDVLKGDEITVCYNYSATIRKRLPYKSGLLIIPTKPKDFSMNHYNKRLINLEKANSKKKLLHNIHPKGQITTNLGVTWVSINMLWVRFLSSCVSLTIRTFYRK
jgi:hypothetical protein